MKIFIFVFLISSLIFSSESCTSYFQRANQALMQYNFIEAEKILEDSTKTCVIDDAVYIYNLLTKIYLWREKPEKAKPIIDKIVNIADYYHSQAPLKEEIGKSRVLEIIYYSYTNDEKEMEKEIANFSNLNFSSQEAILFYLLRKNDKRFLNYYGIRKQVKGDNAPFLCKVYCKRNKLVKDCPCTENLQANFKGGIYYFIKKYLDGAELNVLKKEIEEKYKDANGLKKEIFDLFGIK